MKTKDKKYTKDEILEILSESAKEVDEIINKQYKGQEDEEMQLFETLNKMKDELLLVATIEAIKKRL